MSDKQVKIGLDRFLAQEWADYALELFLSSEDEKTNYELLKNYINTMVPGIESSRKTANQLKRLWINKRDENLQLRSMVTDILKEDLVIDKSIFHLGMAINVFPIFRETCCKIGELGMVVDCISSQDVINRVTERYINPTSIPRIVTRVMQTLADWRMLNLTDGKIELRQKVTGNLTIASWFILSVMNANSRSELLLRDWELVPEKLGVNIFDLRECIQDSSYLTLRRSLTGEEVIEIKGTGLG
jgi:hypothetical protein